MVNFCIVSGCKQESYPGCGKSFHRIPTNDERRLLWITALKLKSNVSKSACVCSSHFKDEDYVTVAKSKLKPEAVPTVFPKKESKQNRVLSYENMKILCPESTTTANDTACRMLNSSPDELPLKLNKDKRSTQTQGTERCGEK